MIKPIVPAGHVVFDLLWMMLQTIATSMAIKASVFKKWELTCIEN